MAELGSPNPPRFRLRPTPLLILRIHYPLRALDQRRFRDLYSLPSARGLSRAPSTLSNCTERSLASVRRVA